MNQETLVGQKTGAVKEKRGAAAVVTRGHRETTWRFLESPKQYAHSGDPGGRG